MAAILLIDDDPHQRAVAALVLSEAGHTLVEASDGQEGLRLALDQKPELIVCDVVMPGMNGYQLVAAVRAEPAICTTPVILLTSLSGRAQVRTGMTAGADDYLPKPFAPAELREAVDTLLQRRRSQFQAFFGSVKQHMEAALDEQRETLAARYESQLLEELNARWKSTDGSGAQLQFEQATVLVADLFAMFGREAGRRPDPAQLMQRAHEAASDALYLFGAVHVLPHGSDVLAVFPAAAGGQPDVMRPLRGAHAMLSAICAVLGSDSGEPAPLAIGLDTGPLALVRLQDPLHGDAGLAAVPGVTVQRAQALRALAQEQGWAVAASAAVAGTLAGKSVDGRRVPSADGGGDAVELLRPRV